MIFMKRDICISLCKQLLMCIPLVMSSLAGASLCFAATLDTMTIENITTGTGPGTIAFDIVMKGTSIAGHEFDLMIDHTPITHGKPGNPIGSFSWMGASCVSLVGPQFTYDQTNLTPDVGSTSHDCSSGDDNGTIRIRVDNLASNGGWAGGNLTCSYFLDQTIRVTCPTVYFPPVVTRTCTVMNNSYTIDFGTLDSSIFKGIGSRAPIGGENIDMQLDCSPGTTVDARIVAREDNSYEDSIALTPSPGMAHGVSIQMTDSNDAVLQLNRSIPVITSATDGPNIIHWRAYYIQTLSEVSQGSADGMATVSLSYN